MFNWLVFYIFFNVIFIEDGCACNIKATGIVRKVKALADTYADWCLIGSNFTYFSTLLLQKTGLLVRMESTDIVRKAKALADTYTDWC